MKTLRFGFLAGTAGICLWLVFQDIKCGLRIRKFASLTFHWCKRASVATSQVAHAGVISDDARVPGPGAGPSKHQSMNAVSNQSGY